MNQVDTALLDRVSLSGYTSRLNQLTHISLIDGKDNTTIGLGTSVAAGSNSVLLGAHAGTSLDATSDGLVVVGAGGGHSMRHSTDSVIIGRDAGRTAREVHKSVFVGGECAARVHSANYCTAVGYNAAGYMAGGQRSTMVGSHSGAFAINTTDNTFVGYASGARCRSGAMNVCVGASAGERMSHGSHNVFVGYDAGSDATTSNTNTVVGSMAGTTLRGNSNTFVGSNVAAAAIADDSVAVGARAFANAVGRRNAVVGAAAATDMRGNLNTVVGFDACANLRGNDNVLVGAGVGRWIATSNSVGIGRNAMMAGNGVNNVVVGSQSGESVEGADNTLVGTGAFRTLLGNNNVIIGSDLLASSVPTECSIVVGSDIVKDQSLTTITDSVIIGSRLTLTDMDSSTLLLHMAGLGEVVRATKNNIALGSGVQFIDVPTELRGNSTGSITSDFPVNPAVALATYSTFAFTNSLSYAVSDLFFAASHTANAVDAFYGPVFDPLYDPTRPVPYLVASNVDVTSPDRFKAPVPSENTQWLQLPSPVEINLLGTGYDMLWINKRGIVAFGRKGVKEPFGGVGTGEVCVIGPHIDFGLESLAPVRWNVYGMAFPNMSTAGFQADHASTDPGLLPLLQRNGTYVYVVRYEAEQWQHLYIAEVTFFVFPGQNDQPSCIRVALNPTFAKNFNSDFPGFGGVKGHVAPKPITLYGVDGRVLFRHTLVIDWADNSIKNVMYYVPPSTTTNPHRFQGWLALSSRFHDATCVRVPLNVDLNLFGRTFYRVYVFYNGIVSLGSPDRENPNVPCLFVGAGGYTLREKTIWMLLSQSQTESGVFVQPIASNPDETWLRIEYDTSKGLYAFEMKFTSNSVTISHCTTLLDNVDSSTDFSVTYQRVRYPLPRGPGRSYVFSGKSMPVMMPSGRTIIDDKGILVGEPCGIAGNGAGIYGVSSINVKWEPTTTIAGNLTIAQPGVLAGNGAGLFHVPASSIVGNLSAIQFPDLKLEGDGGFLSNVRSSNIVWDSSVKIPGDFAVQAGHQSSLVFISSSGLTVAAPGVLSGNGSGLTNVPASSLTGQLVLPGDITLAGLIVSSKRNVTTGFSGGPLVQQGGWDAPGTTHAIPWVALAAGCDNISGTLHVHASNKAVSGKCAHASMSVIKTHGAPPDVLVLHSHASTGMATFRVSTQGTTIYVDTDADCAVCWTFIAAV